eukprot:15441884-Alexandrium_andersonii.AAC.1
MRPHDLRIDGGAEETGSCHSSSIRGGRDDLVLVLEGALPTPGALQYPMVKSAPHDVEKIRGSKQMLQELQRLSANLSFKKTDLEAALVSLGGSKFPTLTGQQLEEFKVIVAKRIM